MSNPVRLQTGKCEQVVKILDIPDSKYLFVGQKGTVVTRNSSLDDESRSTRDLFFGDKKPQSICRKTKKSSFAVTDASYLEASKHYCLSTTNGTLHFIHGSDSAQWETFRVVDFPGVPTCLESNFKQDNSHPCELFIGDHKGSIYILTYLYPRTMLFARNYSFETQVIRFHDMKQHEDYVSCKKIPEAHSDVIDKMVYVYQRHCLISNSKLDSENSLVIHRLTSQHSIQKYRIGKDVTCFDICEEEDIIVAGCKDFQIRIWSLSDPEMARNILEGHKAVVGDVQISAIKNRILSICKEQELLVWELRSSQIMRKCLLKFPLVAQPERFGKSVLHLMQSSDSSMFATCGDCTIVLKF